MPEPQITPTRSGFKSASGRLAFFIASSTTAIAYCVNGSIFRDSFRSMNFSGSKPLTSQANLVLNFVVSNFVIGAAPLFPFFNPSQYSLSVLPKAVSAPAPVITTRLKLMRKRTVNDLFLHVLFQVRNRLTYGRDVLCLIVRNGEVKFLFELHDEFYSVQTVSAKVVGEASLRGNFRLFYAKLVNDDLLYFLCNFRHDYKV